MLVDPCSPRLGCGTSAAAHCEVLSIVRSQKTFHTTVASLMSRADALCFCLCDLVRRPCRSHDLRWPSAILRSGSATLHVCVGLVYGINETLEDGAWLRKPSHGRHCTLCFAPSWNSWCGGGPHGGHVVKRSEALWRGPCGGELTDT